MMWSSYINAKPFLLVTAGLLLTYVLAFASQAIFMILMMISLLWWVRHHTGALPVLSTSLNYALRDRRRICIGVECDRRILRPRLPSIVETPR
jgi:hypothetical protein